jgi:hypothetical protein
LSNAQAIALLVLGMHVRTFEFEQGWMDSSGTIWLIVISTSICLDLWPVGDKLLQMATDECGEEYGLKKQLPI